MKFKLSISQFKILGLGDRPDMVIELLSLHPYPTPELQIATIAKSSTYTELGLGCAGTAWQDLGSGSSLDTREAYDIH